MNVLYINVDCLKNINLFEEKLGQMSKKRRVRTLSYRYDADKRLSLGAGILLDEGLKKIGYRERELSFDVNEQGKPYYSQLPNFYFNLSHSGSYAAAVFGESLVGIDIEQNKNEKMKLKIAKRFFSEREYEMLKTVGDEDEQAKLFYQIWTLKESFVKMVGQGMSIPFSSFDVLPKDFLDCSSLLLSQSFSTEVTAGEMVCFNLIDDIKNYSMAVCSKKREEVKCTEVKL